MKYGVYSIRDLKVGFGHVWTAVNDSVAERFFRSQVSDLVGDAADYQLFKVGVFDLETGALVSCDTPVFLIGGETDA